MKQLYKYGKQTVKVIRWAPRHKRAFVEVVRGGIKGSVKWVDTLKLVRMYE